MSSSVGGGQVVNIAALQSESLLAFQLAAVSYPTSTCQKNNVLCRLIERGTSKQDKPEEKENICPEILLFTLTGAQVEQNFEVFHSFEKSLIRNADSFG